MIHINNLSYSYTEDDILALNDVSLVIPSNKHTSILGHNGSGKSTLARLLIGLIKPTKGQISIDDIILNDENLSLIRSKVGIVFQNPDNQFIGASVADDIAFGLENKCVKQADMQGIIEANAKKVMMEDYLQAEPSSLSGGQKQRVAIAGVLAMNPSIMIFDEATTMLDPKGVKEVNEAIATLNENHDKTIISITHDMKQAAQSDYVIVLKDGKVLIEGTPKEVFIQKAQLLSTGLDIPFSLKVSYSLIEEGYQIPLALDIKELKENLCQLK
ncbi:MAG: energy-coupling factor transporter ATPase [Bacilli bacterium]